MDQVLKDSILAILEKEMIPALGCTEPATYAYVAAMARKYAPGPIKEIICDASSAMIKGVQYVKIPGSGGLRGGKLSSAIGAICGDPDLELGILSNVSPEAIKDAQKMVNRGIVSINKVPNPIHALYLMVTVVTDEGYGKVAIACTCTNVVYIEQKGNVLLDLRQELLPKKQEEGESIYPILSLPVIYEFATSAPLKELVMIQKAIEMNCAIARDGMDHPYGMQVGRTIRDKAGKGLISMDVSTVAMMWGAAGVDARMGGSMLPAMSNCGSGNQGIACTVPVYYTGKYMGKSDEEILRSITIANLINIFVKTHTGKKNSRMSCTCCAAVAAGGAGCGIAYLCGADEKQLEMVLNTVLGNVAGLFCDGAKSNCALKVSSTISGAIQAVLLAQCGIGAGEFDGLVGKDVSVSIHNFYRIQVEGMKDIKDVLYEIEKEKHGIC